MATSTNDATTHARHTRKHKQSLVRRNHKRARHICHERARARATTTTTTATRTRTPARARNNADGEPRTAQRRTRTQYTFPSKETETTKRPRERERGGRARGAEAKGREGEASGLKAALGTRTNALRRALSQRSTDPFGREGGHNPARSRLAERDRAGEIAPSTASWRRGCTTRPWCGRRVPSPHRARHVRPHRSRLGQRRCSGAVGISPSLLCCVESRWCCWSVVVPFAKKSSAALGERIALVQRGAVLLPPSCPCQPTNQPSSIPPTRHRGISAVVVALSLAYRR